VEGAGVAERGAVAIVYPFDGARFVLDPERSAALQQLEIRVEPDDRALEVRIDGAPIPDRRSWAMTAGAHTITARLGAREAKAVRIQVR
jgi:hypothetical protein